MRRPSGRAVAITTAIITVTIITTAILLLQKHDKGNDQQQHHPQQPQQSGAGVSSLAASDAGADRANRSSTSSSKAPAPAPSSTTTTTTTTSTWLSRLFGGGGTATPMAGDDAGGRGGGASSLLLSVVDLGGMSACYPMDGAEVEAAIIGSECTVLFLTRSSRQDYKITNTLLVRSAKVVVGNPIDLPVLNATNDIPRLFDVQAGGSLDIRSVQLYRGSGRLYDDGSLRIMVGATMRVRLGGLFVGSGVIFREPRQTVADFIEDINDLPRARRRSFGGLVLVVGGAFTCVGCQIVRFGPLGQPLTNAVQVGNNFLVVAGSLVCVGCYTVVANLYGSSVNVGNLGAVMLGTLHFIGGGVTGAAVLTGQFVSGGNIFVGAGVVVNVGLTDMGTFAGIIRAGLGQFAVAGGVMVKVGQMENPAWGVASCFGAGQTYAVPAGVLQLIGLEVVAVQVSLLQVISGGNSYVGSGNMGWHGVAFAVFGVSISQNGLGMRQCVDDGSHELVGTAAVNAVLVRVQNMLGGEVYLGTGMLSVVDATRYSFELVNAAFGGYEYYVGPGRAAFVNVQSTARRLIDYRTNEFSWIAGGQEIQSIMATGGGDDVLVSAGARLSALGVDEEGHNTTDGGVEADGPMGGGKMRRSSLVMIRGGSRLYQSPPPDPTVFQQILDRIRGRRLSSPGGRRRRGLLLASSPWTGLAAGGLPASDLIELWTSATGDDSTDTTDSSSTGSQGILLPQYVRLRGEGQCFLCGVQPLPTSRFLPPPPPSPPGGAGAVLPPFDPSDCLVTDRCADPDAPASSAEALRFAQTLSPEPLLPYQATDQDDADSDGGNVLPDLVVLSMVLLLYCRGDEGGCDWLSPRLTKAAMADWLSEQERASSPPTSAAAPPPPSSSSPPSSSPPPLSYQLSVASASPPPFVIDILSREGGDEDWIRANTEVPPLSDECWQARRFLVHLTTSDAQGTATVLRRYVSGLVADTTTLMQAVERAYSRQQPPGSSAAPSVCGASARLRSDLYLPSLSNPMAPQHYQSQYLGAGGVGLSSLWPSVTLLHDQDLAPVKVVHAGEEYTILLQNFSLRHPGPLVVEVLLVRGLSTAPPLLITTLTDPQQPIPWMAPAPPEASPGIMGGSSRYFLLAQYQSLPGIFAFSLPFQILPPSQD